MTRERKADWNVFASRLNRHFERLFVALYRVYGDQYDFFYYLEELLVQMAQAWFEKSPQLKALDVQREAQPHWFESNRMAGAVCYVDLFAGDLNGLRKKIPYLKELGITYLHLMPLFLSPKGDNDGGYAVSSYRQANPPVGTMEQLNLLAGELRQEGISLALDFVFNHTSDEHAWAKAARAGDGEYRQYYLMFSERAIADAYEKHLREIFPDVRPGCFTYLPDIQKWVWTTFKNYQWDLNYANQAVFNSMAAEMLFLAGIGVEVLRLDAVAFIWKQRGTNCENLPQAHWLIQAFNAVAAIAAPAMVFKSEAIVHPDEVIKYVSPEECQLSYNPLLMALLWNSLATREVRLLAQALRERFALPEGCAWVNYVRCHDDIGWTFSDEDAAKLGIDGYHHRKFLNDFYTGKFRGSFGRGLPFQENPRTGDCRISGSCASLAGLEKALKEETEDEVNLAIRRILLLHGVIMTVGGIPLIYLGDEIATLNDYSYQEHPAKAGDSRWVHRPALDQKSWEKRSDRNSVEGRVYAGLTRLIQLRKKTPAFAGQQMQVMDSGSDAVLGYARTDGEQRVLVFANFTEMPHVVPADRLRLYGLGYRFTNLLEGNEVAYGDLRLAPYEFLALACG